MPKALLVNVMSNPNFRSCASGGITEIENEIYLECDKGPFTIEESNPKFCRVHEHYGHAIIRPVNNLHSEKTVGPMFGGNFAHSSDARFTEMIENITGYPFYGAVPIHDRWETPEQYQLLSD